MTYYTTDVTIKIFELQLWRGWTSVSHQKVRYLTINLSRKLKYSLRISFKVDPYFWITLYLNRRVHFVSKAQCLYLLQWGWNSQYFPSTLWCNSAHVTRISTFIRSNCQLKNSTTPLPIFIRFSLWWRYVI